MSKIMNTKGLLEELKTKRPGMLQKEANQMSFTKKLGLASLFGAGLIMAAPLLNFAGSALAIQFLKITGVI